MNTRIEAVSRSLYERSSNFAMRLGAGVLLQIPHGYSLLTTQWRYRLLYLLRRPHDRDFRALRMFDLPADPLLLDVGGNIGQSVLSMFGMIPSARIVSFEPNPVVRQKLERLTAKFAGLTVMPYGLSDKDEEAELFVPVYKGNELAGLASFDYRAAEEWLSADRMLWFRGESLALMSEIVLVHRLDDCELEPDFIKIDVQGLEDRVIAGGLETIKKCRPIIMAETTGLASDAHTMVSALDYRLVEWHDSKFVEVTGVHRRVNQFLIPVERMAGLPLALEA